MKRFVLFAALAAVAAAPAAAQPGGGSDSERFIEAVKDRNGEKAMDLFNARGPQVLNGRNSKNETALLVAIGRHDEQWTLFLLQKGADPNLASRTGETPLLAAARAGFESAVEWLLGAGAAVDTANRLGETPLIMAVQQRNAPIVKMLLAEGANPDKVDAAQGFSARDYARRDERARDIMALIEAKKPAAAKKMEDFKLE